MLHAPTQPLGVGVGEAFAVAANAVSKSATDA
jgi:hypothetical protein